MSKKVDTIRLKDLISKLQDIYKEVGNLPVVMSRDEEGNGFGTLDPDDFEKFSTSIENDGKILVLWPLAERLDIEDINTDEGE